MSDTPAPMGRSTGYHPAGQYRSSGEPRVRSQPNSTVRIDPARYDPLVDNVVLEGPGRLGEWLGIVLIATLLALIVKTFVVQAFYIPSGSMEQTLMVHDRVLVSKLSYVASDIARGDVIVFDKPPLELTPGVDVLIKRVIGVSGDTVEARNGVVYVNDHPVEEPYLAPGTVTVGMPRITIPDHMLWVMGDHRQDSQDSRFFGPINKDLVIGKAVLRMWPLDDIKPL